MCQDNTKIASWRACSHDFRNPMWIYRFMMDLSRPREIFIDFRGFQGEKVRRPVAPCGILWHPVASCGGLLDPVGFCGAGVVALLEGCTLEA